MKKSFSSLIAIIISLLLIISGTVGLILLQKPLKEASQDIRKDASVSNGQVLVSGLPTSGSTLELGDRIISFQATTQGIQTDGVQLVFNLITNTLGSIPTIFTPSESGLQATYQQIEQTSDGYLISIIATPQQLGQTFSSNSLITIAQLRIKPSSSGNIEISFDREKSKSIISGTNPPQDALNHVTTLNYIVGDGEIKDDDADDNTEIGSVTVKGCNLSCNSNAECEVNHRCYNGQCRLVTNVSSTICQEKPDQGLNFGCNSYCANSKECDSKYSCLENKCRRADNPDDPYCQIPSSTIQNNITMSCDTACGINADCAANLRCYYGSCRLATNVSSTTCTAATIKTVSTFYTDPTMPKGGYFETQTASDSTIPAAIISRPSPSPSPSTDSELLKEETAMDAIINSLREAGIPVNLLPIIALGVGGVLLLLIIIPKIFGNRNKRSSVVNPQQKLTQESSKYEQKLQTKLDELKKQPAIPPTTPIMVKPQVPTPLPQVPTPSPMMKRVKEKGINPPNS